MNNLDSNTRNIKLFILRTNSVNKIEMSVKAKKIINFEIQEDNHNHVYWTDFIVYHQSL